MQTKTAGIQQQDNKRFAEAPILVEAADKTERSKKAEMTEKTSVDPSTVYFAIELA